MRRLPLEVPSQQTNGRVSGLFYVRSNLSIGDATAVVLGKSMVSTTTHRSRLYKKGQVARRRMDWRQCVAPFKDATLTPYEEQLICHNLERIAVALERQNDLTARQADMTFLQLTTNDQSRIEVWDKRRHDENLRLRAMAYPRPPPVPES